jgi:hypothetical protein
VPAKGRYGGPLQAHFPQVLLQGALRGALIYLNVTQTASQLPEPVPVAANGPVAVAIR